MQVEKEIDEALKVIKMRSGEASRGNGLQQRSPVSSARYFSLKRIS